MRQAVIWIGAAGALGLMFAWVSTWFDGWR